MEKPNPSSNEEKYITPTKLLRVKKDGNANNGWWRDSMFLFFNVSGYVVGPLLAALFIGKWLDEKWGTEPWAFVACTLSAFVLSSIGIVVETRKFLKELEQKDKK